jgi:FdhE protein
VAQTFVSWDERIARARLLAAEQSPASNILTFYADLADYQRSLGDISSRPSSPAADFADALDFDAAAAAIPGFLRWLRHNGPAPLAQAAADGEGVSLERWRDLMRQRVADDEVDSPDDDAAMSFVVEAILQPFAERAAMSLARGSTVRLKADTTHGTTSTRPGVRTSRCPICGSRPAVGALREEGHGARRTLICALCLTEWDYLRVRCPACDEERFDALPVYTADTLPHARVDACDTCRTYLKTVDLTRNGLAVPLVDDLATVSLDLWAREHGYRRLRPHLLRI